MSSIDLSKIKDRNPHLKLNKNKLQLTASAGDSNKQNILNVLTEFCNTELTLHLEYKFSNRKFRFDYYIEELKLAIEYEGIYTKKSRHTTTSGYTRDTEKYNLATLNGIFILRYTASTYINLKTDLISFISSNKQLNN